VKKRLVPAAFLSLIAAFAAFGERVSGHGPDAQDAGAVFQGPSKAHWLGTDVLGRDLMSRLASGARISLLVGLAGTAVALVFGLVLGAIAGWRGGWTDAALMRLVDVLYGLPFVFVAILATVVFRSLPADRNPLVALFGSEATAQLVLLFLVLGAVQWLTPARLVRAEVLALRQAPFVEAARALGAGSFRILARHLVPNLAGPLLAYAALMVPAMMLEESFLSFLGLGARDPQASWGSLLSEGADLLNPAQFRWWLVVFPAAALSLTLLSLQSLAESLRAVRPGRSSA
jgi:ABC-type dipeptide/oligopeptide/nickel transport system permease subunit